MKHTKETLEKYAKNEKQLFFCEDDGKLFKGYNLNDYSDDANIYPVLRTAFEVGQDIPFEKGHTSQEIARSLWAICAGAYPSKTSITGFESFDKLPCKTPTQVEVYIKRVRDELAMKTTGPLIKVYNECMAFLQHCSEDDFKNEFIVNMANACREVEEAV